MNIKGINQLYMCKKERRNILYTERTYLNKFKSKIVIDVIIEKTTKTYRQHKIYLIIY